MLFEGKHLHIIAFDIPVPVNYGGAIDIYYKLKAFHSLGVKIHLHCFQYGREQAPELLEFCETVDYYPRRLSPFLLLGSSPFIVASRKSEKLVENLMNDDFPILFEGIHTTSSLNDPRLHERIKVVRTHNIEHHYYGGLAEADSSPFRKMYFRSEARKLKLWEKTLTSANAIAAISMNDEAHFRGIVSSVSTVSAFHPDEEVTSIPGMGDFVLYHGSLDVSENQRAARWLISTIFDGLNIPLVIAGNKPPKSLCRLVDSHPNITLKVGLDSEQIRDLVSRAHINVLPTFQATGIKLKLLAALYKGRHCVVNTPMVENTGLESLCHVSDEAQGLRDLIQLLMVTPFTMEDIENRKALLNNGDYGNRKNSVKLINLIFQTDNS